VDAEPTRARALDLLVVEDDPRLSQLLVAFLERRGHRVRSAAGFASARAQIVERAPDLLLSDIDLGAESGREALPRLRAEGLLPPTLILSGRVDAELVAELGAIPGVVGLLPKPFELARLEALLEELPRGGPAMRTSS
jgi:DNA-binding response OmpR family regulator